MQRFLGRKPAYDENNSADSKELSEIFKERGYIFICEFCEFEGAKTLYTFPEFVQKGQDKRSEDYCIKKRLARQFLSSDHCLEQIDAHCISLRKEAHFYQEIEIGARNDVIETGEKDKKQLILHCMGTLFKLYDIHSRGNVKACCIVYVTAEADKINIMRRYWMRTLKTLVDNMKKANLVFYYYQVKAYIGRCKEFHRDVKNLPEKAEKLESDGYSGNYYEDERVKTEKTKQKLVHAIYKTYLPESTFDFSSDSEITENDENTFVNKIHSSKHCCDYKKGERDILTCPIEIPPSRENIDNDLEQFRVRSFDSLPKFEVILGCQYHHIINSVEKQAHVFDSYSESFLMDNNDSYYGRMQRGQFVKNNFKRSKIERDGFAFGYTVISSFLNYLTIQKHVRSNTVWSLENNLMDSQRSRYESVTSSTRDAASSSFATNSIHGSLNDLFTPERGGSSEYVGNFGGNLHPGYELKKNSNSEQDLRNIGEIGGGGGEMRRLQMMKQKSMDPDLTMDPQFIGVFERLQKNEPELRVLVCCALIGYPVCLSEEMKTNEFSPPSDLKNLMHLFASFVPNVRDRNFFWLKPDVDKETKDLAPLQPQNFGKRRVREYGRNSHTGPMHVVSCSTSQMEATTRRTSRLKSSLPCFEITKYGNLKTSCQILAEQEKQQEKSTGPERAVFVTQFSTAWDISSEYQAFLYQMTYLLELIHFVNFGLLFLMQKTDQNRPRKTKDLLKKLYQFEETESTLCFKGKLKESVCDQTIFLNIMNEIILFLKSATEEPIPRFHWMPILHTRLLRHKRGRHNSNRENINRL
ncbi:uncharacterized protein LOC142334514 isoform X3 [Convolutriloba macropyga]